MVLEKSMTTRDSISLTHGWLIKISVRGYLSFFIQTCPHQS